MRPKSLDEVLGQQRALKDGSPLRRLVQSEKGGFSSVLLWGPPGSGKTTLARLIGERQDAHFEELSAISASVAQVREVIASAQSRRDVFDKTTVLFLDEIHRFSKAQQDSLLGAVESGVLILVAATTENPSFSVIKPLISRSLVIALEPLSVIDVKEILQRALASDSLMASTNATEEAIEYISEISSGDARRALTLLEAASLASAQIDLEVAKTASENVIAYDAKGDVHYDTISAFIKSVRGSDADAAIHYLARMIAGGEDPRFIARRLMILASEDIGLADPQAMVIAEAAAGVVERIGMPEGRIPLAEVTIYLSLAPKSNRAYEAINRALDDIQNKSVKPVPAPLRSTGAVGYKYPHDDPKGILKQRYAEVDSRYYQPSDHGFEKTLQERLRLIREILEG
ncbi:MAG TPA: replication-associated recombination protein A [Aquiluna sp.]